MLCAELGRAGAVGYGADCHLCCGVRPGPPAMIMAEMPIFVFTSLLLECSHLQGLYFRVQEGTFAELPVCARHRRGSTRTSEPARLRSRAAGTAPRSPGTGCRAPALTEAAGRPRGLGRGCHGGALGLAPCPGQGGWGPTPRTVTARTEGVSAPWEGVLGPRLSCCNQGRHLAF